MANYADNSHGKGGVFAARAYCKHACGGNGVVSCLSVKGIRPAVHKPHVQVSIIFYIDV